MNILIVRNAYIQDFGGAERLSTHLAEELRAGGYPAILVSRQPRLLEYAKNKNIPTVKGWWWSRQDWHGAGLLLFPVYIIWQILLVMWYLLIIKKHRIDAIHLLSKDDFIAGTIAGKILRKKVIWTDCADLKHVLKNNHTWYKNPVGKLVFWASKKADAVCLVSNSEKRLIEKSVASPLPDNYIVVHIAAKRQMAKPIKRIAADRNAVIFCSTSRLVEAKGIGELIAAYSSIEKSGDFRLWLVGDGPDEKHFRKMANGVKTIVFVGHTTSPLPLVSASDIFVQPTHHEGFSLSLTEAAMLGKPMIATNVGGNPEIVNDKNGMLVPVKNAGQLSEAMLKLGKNKPLQLKLGKRAAVDYSSSFDFSKIVKTKIISIYEK